MYNIYAYGGIPHTPIQLYICSIGIFNVYDLAVYTHCIHISCSLRLTCSLPSYIFYFSIFSLLHSNQILYKFVLHGTCNNQISNMDLFRSNRNNNNVKNFYTCVCINYIASGVFCKKKPSLRVCICRTQIVCRSVGGFSPLYDHSILSAIPIPIQHLFNIHFK